MNAKLKKFIGNQGWSQFGIVPIDELQQVLNKNRKVFDKWDKKGFSADLDYLRNMADDRFNPRHKLPDVQSVIVLAAAYESEQKICSKKDGLIARYARGRDYHKVLKKRLKKLSEFLKSQNPNAATYASVDSGPTVDRVLAKAATLGFFGKNAMIIDSEKGSYFFIASLMTNLNLQATPKREMLDCGDCTRCLDACPTGAITAPGQIDARKCISYLTIENKGGIPHELRDKIGNNLFGCDICQAVCPFNLRTPKQEVKIDDLKGVYGAGDSLDLREVLSIKTDEQFLNKFAGTPLMRAKKRGLLRNACIVAGNSGHTELITDLENLKQREDDPMLQEHAQWAIEKLSRNSSV